MKSVGISKVFSLAVLFGISSLLGAQRSKTAALEELLARVQSNLTRYDAHVPSFFCEEHVLSSQVEPGRRDQNTVTDSIFRLKRTPKPDHTIALVESREIETVDGKPATSQILDGPTSLSGAFEGGLAIVSLDQAACMKYQLQRTDRKRPAEPYVVRFATLLTPRNVGDCLLQEESKGRVLVDPASMQIMRLEVVTPHHTIVDEKTRTSAVGKREISVDYAPVLLGGESFWMPATIDMRVTQGAGTFHPVLWTFRATYRNYHKLDVSSRILPAIPRKP